MDHPSNSADTLDALDELSAHLELSALDALSARLELAVAPGQIQSLADDELLGALGAIERLGRRIDALRVEAAGEVGDRSRVEHGRDGLSARKGCRNASELIERITLVSGSTARRRLTIGHETRTQRSLSGDPFPARFPHVAEALSVGTLGLDAAVAIVTAISHVMHHASLESMDVAESSLVAAATGASPEHALPFPADGIRVQAMTWRAFLDPDGIEPSEDQAMRERSFRLGRESGGVVKGYFTTVPDVAARIRMLFDAYVTPRSAPAFVPSPELDDVPHSDTPPTDTPPTDTRTADQKRHDIFVGIIDSAARSGDAPQIGGAAPTVWVSVRADDLLDGTGAGFIDGVESPVSIRTIRQFACTGGIQKVWLNRQGRIVQLGSPERCFTSQQRRAIGLRDEECVIFGCGIPASWCEIHHVEPAASHGPTHPDNGVTLCWAHHRSIETSGWQIRMVNGVPQLKAPPWLERDGRWRPSKKSRIRLLDAPAGELATASHPRRF
jgi:hypothetical protein